jgi:histidyl-tRNA synthetase
LLGDEEVVDDGLHGHALDRDGKEPRRLGVAGGPRQGDTRDGADEGAAELREVLELVRALGVPESAYALNFSIARGLDYYTGTVYETTLNDWPEIGSICSGGRYEDLASHYTKSKLPGVGISIGATRLFWQLREAGIISTAESSVEVMVGLVDDSRLPDSLDIARRLRAAGINAEVQLEAKKLAKQFQYGSRAGIRSRSCRSIASRRTTSRRCSRTHASC